MFSFHRNVVTNTHRGRGDAKSAFLLACVSILPLSGCGLTDWAHNGLKVGPEYRRPGAAVSDYWIEAGDRRLTEGLPNDPQWWSTLNDPLLDSLIETAYGQNLSLREAGWRVMQARAGRRTRMRRKA